MTEKQLQEGLKRLRSMSQEEVRGMMRKALDASGMDHLSVDEGIAMLSTFNFDDTDTTLEMEERN